jgi:vacuolar iron transporter family protein
MLVRIEGAIEGIIITFAVVAGFTRGSLARGCHTGFRQPFSGRLLDGREQLPGTALRAGGDRSRDRGAVTGEGKSAQASALHGLATFGAFVVAGVVPLAAYLLPVPGEARFPLTSLLALATLFGVGAARAFVTRRRWWRDGLEMLLVGFLAAAVAYGVGDLLGRITGVRS